jgi:hypothetical protein
LDEASFLRYFLEVIADVIAVARACAMLEKKWISITRGSDNKCAASCRSKQLHKMCRC